MIPGRFIVTLRDGESPAAVAAAHGVDPDYTYHTVLNGFAGAMSDAAREGMLRDARGLRVERDGIVITAYTVQDNATWGLDRNVNLYAVRVLDCGGSGTWSGVIDGMDWVAENARQPAVANMSLGGGSSASINYAVANMYDNGVPVIVAAGNGNRGGREQDACDYSPAGAPEAYTVGATTSSDSKTSWSTYGDCVDIFAPGASITAAWHTSDSDTRTISGTSMASPHVAGVAALYLQGNSNASAGAVYAAVSENSTKNIVTNSRTANNHLLYSLWDGSDGGGDDGDDDDDGECVPNPAGRGC